MATRETLASGEDQRALRETLRGFLAEHLSSAVLRACLDSENGYSPELHERLAREFGLAGLTLPAAFGGRGLSLEEAGLVHAELGRVLYPGPFLASSLAARVLLAAGGDIAGRWLPLLASGSVNGTVAAAGEDGRWAPGADSVRAKPADHGWLLYGRRWFVLAGQVASILVVPAVTPDGLGMFGVEAGSAGLSASRQLGIDLTRRICVTTFDETPALLLRQGDDAVTALARAEHEFLLATAAEGGGGIGWCLDATLEYAQDREKFGHPVGSFGAVAQRCADMLTDFQAVSSSARYAAVATVARQTDGPLASWQAALQAGEAYRRVTESAIALFGEVTWEHDAHLYYRRAWSAERLYGGPPALRAAISDFTGL